MIRARAIAILAVVFAGAGLLVMRDSGGAGARRHATVTSVASVRRIGPLSRGTIDFALNLRLRERALSAYLAHAVPGGAASGGLTAAKFGSRFGLSDGQMSALRATLSQLGITVRSTYTQRTEMLVSGRVSRVDELFGLRFGRYETAAGEPYFAPETTPQLPASLAPYITGLGDLSDRPLPAADIPASGLTPNTTAKAYDITPLWNAGIRGQGQTIAIASAWGAVNPADITAFARRVGLRSNNVEIKQLGGGTPYEATNGSDGEVDLDLQVVLSVASGATIIDYQGPGDSSDSPTQSLGHSLADIYNQIEQDGKAKIVSTSYGECESLLAQQAPGDQQLIDNSLKALEASNVTVFIATGDSGAYACLQGSQIQPNSNLPSEATTLSVQAPATSPYAVSVGGTRLELRSDNSYLAESAWSDPLERAGGGGGVSLAEPRPAWQQGPGVIEPGLNPSGKRQIPDVAGPADPDSGFLVCMTPPGGSAPSCGPGNGGTSAASPFWAASMLLVQQYAAAHHAGRLAQCFAGPVLYDLAAKTQPVPPFHHVTFGNNGYYSAGPAWNYATGLGSPDVFNLAQDYTAFMRARSSHSCPF